MSLINTIVDILNSIMSQIFRLIAIIILLDDFKVVTSF